MSDITPIGVTNFRNEKQPFGIKDADRFNHIYVIGKTGTGKSTLLLNMAISDIQRGNGGICLIDPHGDIAEQILDYVPKERIEDVIYFNPGDADYLISFNPLQEIQNGQEHLVVAGLIATFKRIWVDSWGPRLEYILRYALLTLCSYPERTLLDIQPLLTNYTFRQKVLAYCRDEYILSFWYNEFDKYSSQSRAEAISPILNKAGLFSAIAKLRNVIGQTKSDFQIRNIMDQRKILICNVSKGKLGEDATTLLGSIIVNAIQITALNRASQEEENRKPFYLYVDEMHSFISLSFADILAEARKYKLSLFLAHQYIEQIHEKIRYAIFGNVGTIIIFRVGAEDARHLAQEVYPTFAAEDLINLPKYAMYLKLMIDGSTSIPFSAETLPLTSREWKLKNHIKATVKKKYGKVGREITNQYVSHEVSSERGNQTNTLFE